MFTLKHFREFRSVLNAFVFSFDQKIFKKMVLGRKNKSFKTEEAEVHIKFFEDHPAFCLLNHIHIA